MSDSSDAFNPTPKQDLQPGAPYRKGDLIGQKYEVLGILGVGGFGIVYLVSEPGTSAIFALKTFKDEYLTDQEVTKRFHKEASIWIELGHNPYLVRAYFVDEMFGRLYVGMEYVNPNDHGLNSLQGYLDQEPPDLAQSLRWAIQICHGMEYAYSKGVRAHRDLKPANIMIARDGIAKITDFGLAGVLTEFSALRPSSLSAPGLSGQTRVGTGMGTPTHMAPEQFDNAALCDERSDIYSFGVVLYQMATGGQLPFLVSKAEDFWLGMRQLHHESSVPRLDSPLFPIIQRCLEKSPEKRYQTFKEVRTNLEPLLSRLTGEVIIPAERNELEWWEWVNKAGSLNTLGRYEEGMRCCDKALELDPRNAMAWNSKGSSLDNLGRFDEAILCFDKALEIDPHYAAPCNNKGSLLGRLGRYEESIRCFDRALEIDPRHAASWSKKGASLSNLGRYEESIRCCDKALEFDSRDSLALYNKGASLLNLGHEEEAIVCFDESLKLHPRYVASWAGKGSSLGRMGHYEESIVCFDKALEIDPRYAAAWIDKGNSLSKLDRYEEAIACLDDALEIDPCDVYVWFNKAMAEDKLGHSGKTVFCYQQVLVLAQPQEHAEQIDIARKRLRELGEKLPEGASREHSGMAPEPTAESDSPTNATAWNNRGAKFFSLRRYEEAIHCFDQALELDPRYVGAWSNKGAGLGAVGRHDEAIGCYNKALEIDPSLAMAWNNKGQSLNSLGRYEEAASYFDKALELDPGYAAAWNNKSNNFRKLGRYEESIQCCDKALDLEPLLVEPWMNKGNCLFGLNRWEEAVRCYDRALELGSLFVDLWFSRGLAEDELRNWQEAVFSYGQFLAVAPAEQYAKQIEDARQRIRALDSK